MELLFLDLATAEGAFFNEFKQTTTLAHASPNYRQLPAVTSALPLQNQH